MAKMHCATAVAAVARKNLGFSIQQESWPKLCKYTGSK